MKATLFITEREKHFTATGDAACQKLAVHLSFRPSGGLQVLRVEVPIADQDEWHGFRLLCNRKLRRGKRLFLRFLDDGKVPVGFHDRIFDAGE